jgi:hypothetical protein
VCYAGNHFGGCASEGLVVNWAGDIFGFVARHFGRLGGSGRQANELATGDEVHGVVQDIAEGIYRAELRRGGWAADLGVFGPDLFLEEASACVRAIELGADQDGPPTP